MSLSQSYLESVVSPICGHHHYIYVHVESDFGTDYHLLLQHCPTLDILRSHSLPRTRHKAACGAIRNYIHTASADITPMRSDQGRRWRSVYSEWVQSEHIDSPYQQRRESLCALLAKVPPWLTDHYRMSHERDVNGVHLDDPDNSIAVPVRPPAGNSL